MDLSKPVRVLSLPWRLARADAVYIWFASLHSFFPALFGWLLRKPVVTVVGAYDVANIPELHFGLMGHPWKKYVVRAVCRASTELTVYSEYGRRQVESNVGTKTPIRLIPLGVEFPPVGPPEREPIVLTVGQIRKMNLTRKGLEIFARAAVLVPEAQFIIAGQIMDASGTFLESIAPPNLTIRDHLPQAELEALYSRASVYVQASTHESFALTVVEAMAAGALPVISGRGALPDTAGPDAIVVDESSAESVAAGIRAALALPSSAREAAAAYARNRFPLDRRRADLPEFVGSLIS